MGDRQLGCLSLSPRTGWRSRLPLVEAPRAQKLRFLESPPIRSNLVPSDCQLVEATVATESAVTLLGRLRSNTHHGVLLPAEVAKIRGGVLPSRPGREDFDVVEAERCYQGGDDTVDDPIALRARSDPFQAWP